jgi:hypothetical protein
MWVRLVVFSFESPTFQLVVDSAVLLQKNYFLHDGQWAHTGKDTFFPQNQPSVFSAIYK